MRLHHLDRIFEWRRQCGSFTAVSEDRAPQFDELGSMVVEESWADSTVAVVRRLSATRRAPPPSRRSP
jgi:hypothetical protein